MVFSSGYPRGVSRPDFQARHPLRKCRVQRYVRIVQVRLRRESSCAITNTNIDSSIGCSSQYQDRSIVNWPGVIDTVTQWDHTLGKFGSFQCWQQGCKQPLFVQDGMPVTTTVAGYECPKTWTSVIGTFTPVPLASVFTTTVTGSSGSTASSSTKTTKADH